MNARIILFATDFSPQSDFALTWATSLARDTHAKLIILHVEQIGVPYGGGEIYSEYVLGYQSDSIKKRLEKMRPADSQVRCSHRMATGKPAIEIIRVAEEVGADMIVMSTHGRSGLPRMLMGSVAEDVVRHAHCLVVVVKQPHATSRDRVAEERIEHDVGVENLIVQNGQ